MSDEFISRFARALRRSPESVNRSAPLNELGVDSFELVDVLVRLQEEMNVRIFQEDLANVQTVGDLETLFDSRRAG